MKINKIIVQIIVCLSIVSCNNFEKQEKIAVTVKVIDSYTKKPRVNDTVTVREAEWGFPVRRYIEVGRYITDTLGIVALKIDKKNRYSFETDGPNFAFGSNEFGSNELKNKQQIIIEVVPPEKKKIRIE
ncbi:hypothetical protein M2T82_00800 [Elizabethkingia ursingii]|uniref:hypothetical protein n=1 Tax=Elizabethkingia ursingii TaxID=1756150 RepID=UPI002012B875|nr:hypothetical protein [Elizabethkingia ursingii]MCL1666592.1 hypothetical protein [Elizabethkingia ursingii]